MTTSYSPSPRPTFDVPTLIRYADVTRHLWGDDEAGVVADWIYASSQEIHALVFGLPAGGRFEHSAEFRTIFGADELLYVLDGTMVIANPQTGEVERIAAGGMVSFGAGTWHHAYAHGGEPLRVLELFAPPPATGTSGAYARTQPYLERSDWRYWRDPDAVRTLRVVRDSDVVWERDLGVLVGVVLDTPQLRVGVLELNPGDASAVDVHTGAEVAYCLDGRMHVRAIHSGERYVFEVEPHDAVYLPPGAEHEYASYEARPARALLGVAPPG